MIKLEPKQMITFKIGFSAAMILSRFAASKVSAWLGKKIYTVRVPDLNNKFVDLRKHTDQFKKLPLSEKMIRAIIRLLSKLHLPAKIFLFGKFFAKFFDPIFG